MALLTDLVQLWRQYRTFNRVRAELDAMSNRELADIGVARNEIVRVAFEAAERSPVRLVAGTAHPAARLAGAAGH